MKKRNHILPISFLSLLITTLPSCQSLESQAGGINNYTQIGDGIYVSHAPGLYGKSFFLNFKTDSPDIDIYYTMDCNINGSNTRKYVDPIPITSKVPTNASEFPLTTSVDGILASDTEGRCISNAYNDRIQRTGNYVLHPKQNVVTIKAVNKNDGSVLLNRSLSYILHDEIIPENIDIPVVSLSLPYDDIFGSGGFYNKIREEIEKRANLEFIDPKYNEYFYRNTQIKLGGNWTMGYPQRTLNLNFNKDENGDKNEKVKTHVFEERKIRSDHQTRLTKITRFRLHNGGNAFEDFTGVNDAALQRMMDFSHTSTTAYRPCITYINGEYWGIYSIREHYKDIYFENNYGVEKDDVVLMDLKGDWVISDGNEGNAQKEMDALNSFLNFADFRQNNVYMSFITNVIDLPSLLDTVLAHAYGGNWDFLGNFNNLKMWKVTVRNSKNPYADGKWRFCLHDSDFAFSEANDVFSPTYANSYSRFKMMGELLKSPLFREALLTRAEELLKDQFSVDNSVRILDEMISEIKPYKKASSVRWGQDEKTFEKDWMNRVAGTYEFFKNRNKNFLYELSNSVNKYK